MAGGYAANTPVLSRDGCYATAHQFSRACQNFNKQVGKTRQKSLPILQRSALQHDKCEIRRHLVRLAEQLSTHTGMLHSVLSHEDAHTVDRATKHFRKKLTGAQKQGLNTRGRVLTLNQMKI